MADDKTYTVEEIDAMMMPTLRKLAAEHFDADDIKGLRKAQLQELLKENTDIVTAEEVDDDEIDDELDDEVDDEDTPADADDELDDIEVDEDEEIDEPAPEPKKARASKAKDLKKTEPKKASPPEPSGDTLTAKQVATRIGTDSKTLRKFFRSDKSTVEAVGQGGRYEFAKEDLAKIEQEFKAWNTTRPTRAAAGEKADKPSEPKRRQVEELDDDELELDDEADGPSTDELEDLDDLELDDDELDD